MIYLLLWIYGLIVGEEHSANFVLGIGMITLGVLLSRGRTRLARS